MGRRTLRLIRVAILIALASCNKKESDVIPEPEETTEVLGARFYRAPGGWATLRFPDLKGWTVLGLAAQGSTRSLGLVLGTPERPEGTLRLLFYPPAEEAVRARDVADRQVQALEDEHNLRLTEMKVSEVDLHPEGKMVGRVLQTSSEALASFGVAVGRWSVGVVVRSSKPSFQKMIAVLYPLVKGLDIGDQVARLPAHDPGTRLHGVYRGPSSTHPSGSAGIEIEEHWFVFDRRGYCHRRAPASVLDADIEAAYQADRKGVGKYTVRGDKLIVRWPGADESKMSLTVRDRDLVIEGREYQRVDGLVDGLVLKGTYVSKSFHGAGNFFASSSSRYTFSSSGRFSSGSLSTVSGSERTLSGQTAWTLSGFSKGRSNAGSYRVQGDRLELEFENGRIVSRTIYPVGGQRESSTTMFYIDGSAYLREE